MQKDLRIFMVNSLQNHYMDNLIDSKHEISLHLKNGNRMIGKLISHDKDVIFFRCGVTQMIRKTLINKISNLN